MFGYRHFLTTIDYFRQLYTTFGGHILILAAMHYFRRISAAIYYFWPLYTFDGYIILLNLPDYDFVRIQDLPAISCAYGLKTRLEFNINLLTLIQFCFSCSSMVSSVNFNLPFLKCCFIRNTQMLKMGNFLQPCTSNGIYK